MKLIKHLKIMLLSFLALFIPIGICTWAISGAIKEEQIKAEYVVNPLTEYVLEPSNGEIIYDDTLGNTDTYLGYDISSDFTFNTDNRTVELGDPHIYGGITINHSIHFSHSNLESLNYSQDQFLNTNLFAVDKSNVVSGYNDVNLAYNTNRLFTIKLVSNLTLTGNSSLSIGAKLGTNTNTGVSGAVISGENICLDLNGHVLTINEGCSLNAFGYIIDSKIDSNGKHIGKILNYGTVYTNFVVEDFHGGGNTVGRGFASEMPFSIYSIPYLSCALEIRNNGNMVCNTMLFANEVMNKTSLYWYGSDENYFIQSNNGNSYVIFDTYNNLNTGSSYNQTMKTYYFFNGDFTMNNLMLQIIFEALGQQIKAQIDMAQFSFLIPPYAHITLGGKDSKFKITMNLLFLPGAALCVEENAELVFSQTDYKSIIRDIPIYGDKVIKSGKSAGGIVSVSQMPPSNATTYSYVDSKTGESISAYSYNYNNFRNYDIIEKENLMHNKARIEINGNLSFEDANEQSYNLAGLIKLSNQAVNSINSNLHSINTFYRKSYNFGNVPGASELIGWVTSGGSNLPTEVSYGGYIILPLVNANSTYGEYNGLVLGKNDYFSEFSDKVHYDFRKGIFYDISKDINYAFILDSSKNYVLTSVDKPDVVGSLKKAIISNDEQCINVGAEKYIYYQGCFVPTNTFKYIDSADGLYIQDLNGSYEKVENGKSKYTYEGQLSYKKFKISESVTGNQARRRYNEKRKDFLGIPFGDWFFDSYGEFENLPNTDGKVVEETKEEQFVTTSGTVNVENISGNIDEVINETNQIVDLRFLSINGKYNENYVASGLSCSLIASNEDTLNDYGSRTQSANTDSFAILDQNNITELSSTSRYKYEYLDWCYFERTASYIKGDAEINNVILYKKVLSSGSSIKFNKDTNLRTK